MMKHLQGCVPCLLCMWLTSVSSLTSLMSSTPPSASCNRRTNLVASRLRLLVLRWHLGICSGMGVSLSGLCGLPSGSILLDVRGKQTWERPEFAVLFQTSAQSLLLTIIQDSLRHKSRQTVLLGCSWEIVLGFENMMLKTTFTPGRFYLPRIYCEKFVPETLAFCVHFHS